MFRSDGILMQANGGVPQHFGSRSISAMEQRVLYRVAQDHFHLLPIHAHDDVSVRDRSRD